MPFTANPFVAAFSREGVSSFEYIPGSSPLSHWIWPLSISFGYLFTIWGLQAWMKRRPAFHLKEVTIYHNFFLFLLSVVMWLGMAFYVLKAFNDFGSVEPLLCDSNDVFVNRGGLFFWVYIFYLSKFYELLDTVLLALKKVLSFSSKTADGSRNPSFFFTSTTIGSP